MPQTQVTQPNNIPASAGQAPPGMVPTYGGAGIFTGYAPAPQGTPTAVVGGQPKTLPTVATQPVTPVAPTTQPATLPAPTAPVTPPVTPTQGQFYYTQSQDAQGKPLTTYYDANGNVLPTNPIGGDQYKDNPSGTPNAGGNLVQLPSPPTQGGFTENPQTSSQLNTEIQGQTQQNVQQLDELNSQSDQAYSQYEHQLSQIQNGTYPLTPAQKQLYDSTNAQFDVLRQQQVIANTALIQGTEVAEARSGETVNGAQTALGNVGAAINRGLQQLSALDAQGSKALADLQSGFMKDDLVLIQDAYKGFQDYQSAKEKTLNDIFTATTNAEKDLRDFTYQTTQDNIVNTLNQNKFTYQQKQDAITNSLNQARLDETKRAALVAEGQKAEALKLQKDAQNFAMGIFNTANGQHPVQSLASGATNPVSQEQFLAQYPPQIQTKIKGLADYSINPADFPTRLSKGQIGMTRDMAVTLAKMYDPNYDDKQYPARQKFITNWEAGSQNSVIQAANTSVQHLNELYGQSQKLGNATVPAFTPGVNGIKNWYSAGSGDSNVLQFQQTAVALAGELAKIYKNGVGSSAAPTDDEIGQQLALMSANLAPGQYKGLIENGVKLMTDRLNSATQNYTSVMGEPPKSILFPAAMDSIKNLQSQGLNIDVSSLTSTPFDSMSASDLANIFSSSSSTPQSASDPASFANMFLNLSSQAGTLAQ